MKTTFILMIHNLDDREVNCLTAGITLGQKELISPLTIIKAIVYDNNQHLPENEIQEEIQNVLDEELKLYYIDDTTGHAIPITIPEY